MRPIAAAFVAVAVLVSALTSLVAFSAERSGSLAFWALAGGPPIALAAVAALWARREHLLGTWLTPRWGDFSRGMLGAVALFAAAWAFVQVLAPVGSPREIWLASLYGQIGNPSTLRAHAVEVAAVIIAVATAEEIVWRGMVSQLLAERFGSRRAWLVAAALYTAGCIPTAYALRAGGSYDPVLIAAALGGGLLWGAMTRFFGNLVPAIVAHVLFDWAVVMMFPLWGAIR